MSFINTKLKDFEENLKNKKIAIIGLGVSNIPLIDYLHDFQAKITVFDKRNEEKIDKGVLEKIENYKISKNFGENYLSNLKDFDIIFKSPSCRPDLPEIEAEVKRGAILTSEIEKVLELAPCKIIAVTGSDGKTTTTNLTSFYSSYKLGNQLVKAPAGYGYVISEALYGVNTGDSITTTLKLSNFNTPYTKYITVR